ncbi:DinB family protein [Lysinibacillus sphaericus]
MINLFSYNWQVREEWFEWCKALPEEELIKPRIGGMGCILHNLLHVINCERIWISQLSGSPSAPKEYHDSQTLEEMIDYSYRTKISTTNLLKIENAALNEKTLSIKTRKGNTYDFPFKKVLLHIVTHEVHHIGQLSVWAREIGKEPVSSDLIFRKWE